MILLLDNYDSFTYNLVDYLGQIGKTCVVRRNDEPLSSLLSESVDRLVISPGPEVPSKAGHLMEVLSYFAGRIPVLGICLGHQAIGEHFGARLVRAERPMHGKVSEIKVDTDDLLFKGLPENIPVVRYNSLVLEDLPECLAVTSRAENGEIMAIRHRTLCLHGMQFHPEALLTRHGIQMLTNWIEGTCP